ncbi:MAG: hypothetical protein KU37_10925 [Sulfuricurvum sp. PC08-66]|nr:MAG: hypothetical protein KU37_10925 [Sulfuricurvum sp. PC08-66]
MSTFSSENVINRHINNADLNVYFVGFDGGIYRDSHLTDYIMDALVDFAYGYHTGILKTYDRRIMVEAAKSLYSIDEFKSAFQKYVTEDSEFDDSSSDKYLKRGEFGELILHLLLRDFFETVPLLSKIHFKDSYSMTVHGFDAVHVGNFNGADSLFLGESKLYQNGKDGIDALMKDIEEHFTKDYLNKEFTIVGKRSSDFKYFDEISDLNTKKAYEDFLTKKDDWFNKINGLQSGKQKLSSLLSSTTIPLLCTYSSETFTKHNDETTQEFRDEFDKEINQLKTYFDKKFDIHTSAMGANLNIILLLFPVPSKKELVRLLHTKLEAQQRA